MRSVEALDAFTTETSFYIVLEHMPISLDQIVESAKYPTERQLAAILIQVRQIRKLACSGRKRKDIFCRCTTFPNNIYL